MAIDEKLLKRAQTNPADLRFEEAQQLASQMGWILGRRKGGSHRVYHHPEAAKMKGNFPQPLNLQEGKNGKAKAYQVKQMLQMAIEMGIIQESKGV
jgi:hypothetical protein